MGTVAQDPDAYRLIAENLRNHGVFSCSPEGGVLEPTAFRPPLYPVLLAATAWQGRVTPWCVAVLHLLLGTLTVFLSLIVARRWSLGAGSWLVAAMVAGDPILLNQSAQVMTETLATLLAVASLLVLTRSLYKQSWHTNLLVGLVLGCATLCRPTFLIWAVLIVLHAAFCCGRWTGLQRAVLITGGLLLALSPWIIRNQQVLGQPVYATTHGGYTLLLGNNPYFYQHLRTSPWGSVWDARELIPLISQPPADAQQPAQDIPTVPRAQAEIAADRRLYELARETIRQQPGMFAYSSVIRVARLWTPLPHQLTSDESPRRTWARWGVALWYVVISIGALVGLGMLGRRGVVPPWVWGLLCVVAFTLVHSVYWSNMRMRAPLLPMVYLAFAVGCQGIRDQVRSRKSFDHK